MTVEGFYRRPLPEALVAFASDDGRRIFREALDAGGLEGWFALAEQFHTQSDPAYCGLGTLVMVLNALAIDPGRAWKRPWRWFSEELLDCCRPLSVVQTQGITLDEFACLARCNGATAQRIRATDSSEEAFRARVREAAATPGEPFLAVAYARKVLGQTGGGHFSPVAGYHAGRDLALVLDAARFKYPPHWVPVSLLWRAQLPEDPTTGRSRGHVILGRSEAAPNPFFCRIALEQHDWPAVARALTEALPRTLAAAAPASPRALIATLFRELPEDLASLLTTYPADAEAALPPAHRDATRALLAELRGTGLFGVVQGALADEGGAGVAARVQSAELAAMLLLVCPEAVFAGVPTEVRAEMEALRAPEALPPRVRAEVDRLRAQIVALEDARTGGG